MTIPPARPATPGGTLVGGSPALRGAVPDRAEHAGHAVRAYADSLTALPPGSLSGADHVWLDVYHTAEARRAAGRDAPRGPDDSAPGRTGFAAGLQAQYVGTTYVLGDSLYIEQGPGLGVRAGYEITPEIAAFVSAGRARIRTADGALGPLELTTLDVGVQIDSPVPQGLDPYVRLALTLQSAAADSTGTTPETGALETRRLTARGGGGTLGFGVLLAVVPGLALDLSADVTFGRLRELAVNGEGAPDCFCSRTGRWGLGLVYSP